MSEATKDTIDSLSTRIQQMRDELAVQINLGAAEARDEWEQLEDQLGHFKTKCAQLADVAEETGEGLLETASLAGEELVKGYERIRQLAKK
jgi:hypothetical protein